MKTHHKNTSAPGPATESKNRRRGAALVISLALVVLMTVLVVSYFASTTTDLSSTTDYASSVETGLMAETALNVAIGQINDATKTAAAGGGGAANRAWASQPGMIRTYDSSGNVDTIYKLYSADNMRIEVGSASWNALTEFTADTPSTWNDEGSEEEFVNLNAPITSGGDTLYPILNPDLSPDNPDSPDVEGVQGFDPGLSPDGSDKAPMPVRWLYLTDAGDLQTYAGISDPSTIVGRIAFWADDESAKVNINTSSEGNYWDIPRIQNEEEQGAFGGGGKRDSVEPWGYSTSIPAGNEFQRLAGHPAFTSLSSVLGDLLPSNIYYDDSFVYDSQLVPYYSLSPRIAEGGSRAGTIRAVPIGGNTAHIDILVDSDRMYTSVDELIFPSSILKQDNGYKERDHTRAPHNRFTDDYLAERSFFMTASSNAPETTLFNTPRIGIWPLQQDTDVRNEQDDLTAFATSLDNGSTPYFFQRASVAYSIDVSDEDTKESNRPLDPANLGSSQDPTADALIGRNQELLRYLDRMSQERIPGMGASFATKYSTEGESDRRQIIGQFFDYIRSNINTAANAETLSPRYSYTPRSPTGSERSLPGYGSVIPARVSLGGEEVQGFGRTYSIREASLVFMASDFKNEDTLWRPGDPEIKVSDINTPQKIKDLLLVNPNLMRSIGNRTEEYFTFGKLPTFGTPDKDINNNPLPDDAPVARSFRDVGISEDELIDLKNDSNPVISSIFSRFNDIDEEFFLEYDGIGDPQVTEMRAFLLLSPYMIAPGQPTVTPAQCIEIEGLQDMSVTYGSAPSVSLNMPAKESARLLVKNGSNLGPGPETGFYSFILKHDLEGRNPGVSSNGQPQKAGIDDEGEDAYPWASQAPVVLADPSTNDPPPGVPWATYVDEKGEVNLINGEKGRGQIIENAYVPTFRFNGANLTIRIYRGDGVSRSYDDTDLIQEIDLNFPPVPALPVPQIIRAKDIQQRESQFKNRADSDGNSALVGGDPYMLEHYTGYTSARYGPAGKDMGGLTLQSRFQGRVSKSRSVLDWVEVHREVFNVTNNGHDDGVDPLDFGRGFLGSKQGKSTLDSIVPAKGLILRRGDIVRSVAVDPNGPSRGDLRLLAGLKSVTADYFAPVEAEPNDYTSTDTEHRLLHSIQWRGTANIDKLFGLGFHVRRSGDNLVKDWSTSRPRREVRGDLVGGNRYDDLAKPLAPLGLVAATMEDGSPGDWDTGFGGFLDGPYINKADEGYDDNGGLFGNVYFPANIEGTKSLTVGVSYSPTRQVPSPVMFGSLPTGVKRQRPWETLLFCPNPPAGPAHPGFGVGIGGAGANARPPYTELPDHLWLDFFMMPIIEPYAISQPFATGGKINLNQQLAPFDWIDRHTGIYALMKNLKVPAIHNNASSGNLFYKSGTQGNNATSRNPSYRFHINVDETMEGIRNRLDSGLFRSASEICQIFLVPELPTAGDGYPWKLPQEIIAGGIEEPSTYNLTPEWWDQFTLTGDNLRESPYNQLYSRVTTRSNVYRVHYRVQAVKSSGRTTSSGGPAFNVLGEQRGSYLIERYLNPNDDELIAALPDIENLTASLDDYYKIRILESNRFNP